jgi:hypothetical protein
VARVREVLVREAPAGPPGQGEYTTKLQALAAEPTKTVVDAVFDTRKAVEDAVFRVNSGQRKVWPNDRYYAAFDFSIDDEGLEEGKSGQWELLIGLREHAPPGWEPIINAPGSRKRRKASSEDEQDAEYTEESADNESLFVEPTE